jgi:fructuronate reductase
MPRKIITFEATTSAPLSFSPNPSADGNRIVHIGLGAFARAHIAVMTQHANVNSGTGWRISAVVRSNQALAQTLTKQEYRYSVLEKAIEPNAEIIDVIDEIIDWKVDFDKLIDRLAHASTKVVTLTITEKGYCLDQAGLLDFTHQDIQHDLIENEIAQSLIGLLAIATRRRMEQDAAGLVIISCDNLRGNSETLSKALLSFCSIKDKKLSKWIKEQCDFPNTVVDCIVPKVGPDQVAHVHKLLDIDDEVPVICEPYRQWVIADSCHHKLPQWELAGAEFKTDVTLHEELKLRILNASHSVLAYIGLLNDCVWVHQAVGNEIVQQVLSQVMEEIFDSFEQPKLARQYYAEITERFKNTAMEHELSQIACDGSAKIPARWLPTILANQKAERSQTGFSQALAAWLVCWSQIKENKITGVTDPLETQILALVENLLDQETNSNRREQWLEILGVSIDETIVINAEKEFRRLIKLQSVQS